MIYKSDGADMKKVCHFSSVHKLSDIRVFTKECKSLAEAGYSTVLIACAADVQFSGGVTLRAISNDGGRIKRILFRAFEVYRMALKEKADVYHFHDPELLPYGVLLKLKTNAVVIYDSHECYPEDLLNKEWMPKLLRYPVAKIFKIFEDFSAQRLSGVVAATPHIEKRFQGISKNTVVVNNFPKLNEFAIGDGAHRMERDGVCYVGAISYIRGVIPFLDALDKVNPEVKVYLAGTFANADVESAVKNHRNWSRVRYYGQVGREKIIEIYSKSFAGIVNFLPAPNHEFSQPNKLFEYMAAGIPVISSNFDLWKEIVVDTGSGYMVDPGSSIEISQKINELWNDRGLVEKMAANGVSAIKSKFSWESQESKLLDFYKKSIG